MENNLQIFENSEFGKVRTVIVNDEPYLVGKDVATILGYKNTRDAILRHVDDEDKVVVKHDSPSGVQDMVVINESGLYSMTLSSKLEGAKKFKKWVTKDVLPSVRKHGVYATNDFVEQALNDPDFAISMLQKLKQERKEKALLEQKVESQNKQIEVMKPKASYYDAVLNSKGLVSITEIAKDYGMGGKTLNKILHDKKVQYKVNDTWVLYSDYAKKGYTGTKTATFDSSEGVTYSRESTYWTQKGRLFIYELLKKDGKLPIIEIENQ